MRFFFSHSRTQSPRHRIQSFSTGSYSEAGAAAERMCNVGRTLAEGNTVRSEGISFLGTASVGLIAFLSQALEARV